MFNMIGAAANINNKSTKMAIIINWSLDGSATGWPDVNWSPDGSATGWPDASPIKTTINIKNIMF